MKGDTAAAVRKEKIVTIAADELQRGELVLIQTGDIFPADLKLLEASAREVDEFELKGELMPILKSIKPEAEVWVFQGSQMLQGHGNRVVIAEGEDTEYGRILKESSRYIKHEKILLIKKSHFALLLLFAPALLIRLTFYDKQTLTCISYPLLAFLLLLLPNHQLYKSLVLRRQQEKLFKRNIVVGHTVINRIILLSVFRLGNYRFWRIQQGTCAINVFEVEGGMFTLASLNDTCHLR